MLSEIAVRLVFQPDQRIFQNRPAENVNPHRCQITARMLRLLLKFTDLAVRIRHDDPEPTGFLDRNRHRRDRDIRFICFMEIKHYLVIHLINMISRQDQHIIRIILFHIIQILIDRIRRSGVPFAVGAFLVRRKNRNTSHIPVQIPRDPDSDMRIQTQWLILCQNAYGIDPRVDTVAEREINDPILPAKCNRRLRHLCCQNSEPAALSSCEKHGNHLFLHHVVTPFQVNCLHYTILFLFVNIFHNF